jgi:hypothetical protein
MGELVKLAEWRHVAVAKRHLAVGDKCIVRQLHAIAKIPSGPDHSLAVSGLKNMLVSHGLMLRHKDQIERVLSQERPKPLA